MRTYYQDDTWDMQDWANFANTAMSAQRFVNAQEDRRTQQAADREQRARGLQYDQALGALQQGQELPSGIAPPIGMQAQSDYGQFQANQTRRSQNEQKIKVEESIRKGADQVLKGYDDAVRKTDRQAGMAYLSSLPQGSLQQAQSLALANETLGKTATS